MDLVRVGAALLLVLGAGSANAQLLSPGPLSRDHAELEGDLSCGRCHVSGRRVGAQQCNECHRDVGRTVRAGTGLHGRQYRGRSCGECHVEHRGLDTRLVRWPGGSAERFDHDLTGYALRGGHRGPGCGDCHDGRNARGHRTYLGLSQRCNGCHEDAHEGRLGDDCASCHVESRWSAVTIDSFDHGRTRYPLRGAHEQVDCVDCHGQPARYRGLAFAQCSDCHEDPHGGRLGATCSDCHRVSGWSEVAAMRDRHPGLRLSGGHRNAGCDDCHDRGLAAAPSRGSSCISCHRAVHEADFGRRCERCHGSIRWLGLPRRIGLNAHDRTPYPLRGAHLETPCQGCHVQDRPPNARYRELDFDRCADCHADPHGGEFAARDGGACEACHDERGFAPTRFGVEDHATTRFALEGLHGAVACVACHEVQRPRLDWRIPEATCADCHANPHGDQFADEMRLGGCAECHSASGWDRPQIDHSTWPLDGAHAAVACAGCHAPSEEDRGAGHGASYRGAPRECHGCHEDAHAGQFRLSDPVRACTACHSTTSFSVEDFEHERIADYPLVGRHAEAACAACHPTVELRRGDAVTRWRLGYRACRDCHADPHVGGTR